LVYYVLVEFLMGFGLVVVVELVHFWNRFNL